MTPPHMANLGSHRTRHPQEAGHSWSTCSERPRQKLRVFTTQHQKSDSILSVTCYVITGESQESAQIQVKETMQGHEYQEVWFFEAHLQRPAVVVQSLSCARLFVSLQTAAHQASLSFTISQSLFKLISMESVMPSNYLILCLPLLHLSSIPPRIMSFPMSRLFTSGGQSIGASALA